ncbi:hypothetical protein [Maricaulis sp.]|uniref:hypothetical protein n=1 Tax=Maricaulis sp. TaxID=1486257 RepID=UPI002606EC44|nr:hypothetical protein [Maricaulis sp.]
MSKGTCYIVLGMHRSGTSALTGTLLEAGVYLGRVLDQSIKRNPKGLQEAPAVLYMQEDLLKANGGCWHEPPDVIEWGPLHTAVRDLFIESRADMACWAFKDPRTLITLDGWLEALPEARPLGIFRHPMAVARSLESRNGFPIEKGLAVWLAYNSRLLDWQQRLHFPVVQCLSDTVAMQNKLRDLLAALDLETRAPLDFFDANLQTVRESEEDRLPDPVRSVWDGLLAHAL